MTQIPSDIINFWFTEIEPLSWWKKDTQFDAMITDRFQALHQAASMGQLAHWRETPHGRLAEIIVLDQFSRNMFRDTAQSFMYDGLALLLSQLAVEAGADESLSVTERPFLYMPMMHSESLAVHDQAVVLFDQPGLEAGLDFERKHQVIIEKFGRYPHRNEILGRDSTPQEISFLQQPNSSF